MVMRERDREESVRRIVPWGFRESLQRGEVGRGVPVK